MFYYTSKIKIIVSWQYNFHNMYDIGWDENENGNVSKWRIWIWEYTWQVTMLKEYLQCHFNKGLRITFFYVLFFKRIAFSRFYGFLHFWVEGGKVQIKKKYCIFTKNSNLTKLLALLYINYILKSLALLPDVFTKNISLRRLYP